MLPQDVTLENFASIVTSKSSRSDLLEAIRAETGSNLPLTNRVSGIARLFDADSIQIAQIVSAELDANCDDFLRDIVFHPNIDESTLMQILDSGLCIIDLAHRIGPPSLLERIAKEHRTSEAVLTLLLKYYASDDYTESQFSDFVRAYSDVHGVRYEIENKNNLPEAKRQSGQRVLAELPK